MYLKFVKRYLLPYLIATFVLCWALDFLFTKLIVLDTEISNTGKINHLITSDIETIPVFGSSRARCSYIPEILSPYIYNYGLDGTSLWATCALLNIEATKKSTKPIIINFDYDFFAAIGDIKTYIPLCDNPSIKQLLVSRGLYKSYFKIPGIRYFNSFDYFIKEWLNQKFETTKIVKRGYTFDKNQLFYNAASFKKDVEQRQQSIREWRLDKKQNDLLIETIKSMPNRHFYIVAAPYHASYYKSISNIDAVKQYLHSLDSLPNVTSVDFCNHNYPDSLFNNTTHLNHWGAMRFSNELIKIINLNK